MIGPKKRKPSTIPPENKHGRKDGGRDRTPAKRAADTRLYFGSIDPSLRGTGWLAARPVANWYRAAPLAD